MPTEPLERYADPFSLVYDAILREFDNHELTYFNASSTQEFKPDVLANSDFPRWELRPAAMQVSLGNSSCESGINQDFTLGINTGDFVLGKHFYPQLWRMVRALWSLQFGALEPLRYLERRFVNDVSVLNIVTGLANSTAVDTRKTVGWAALWTIRVQMAFDYNTIMGLSP